MRHAEDAPLLEVLLRDEHALTSMTSTMFTVRMHAARHVCIRARVHAALPAPAMSACLLHVSACLLHVLPCVWPAQRSPPRARAVWQ